MDQFEKWYADRLDYQREWKNKTGKEVVGYFCTYTPEEILYAFDILPVRILGTHEPPNISSSHIPGMFCPFSRDVLAQGLLGRYDHLDGIILAQSCLHLRGAFSSWEIHRGPIWNHYLPMPNHVQSERSIPFLVEEYKLLIENLERLTGRKIGDDDLQRGIIKKNNVRKVLRDIYQTRRTDNPPITGAESMGVACARFFTHADDFLKEATLLLESLQTRRLKRDPGNRIMLVGSESDDVEFLKMIENLGETASVGCTVVVEDLCTTTRDFWDLVDTSSQDPLKAIAVRYVNRTPCPTKDWPQRLRIDTIMDLAREYRVDGVIFVHQKFCDPHENDMPFIRKRLEDNGIPTYFLEFDATEPAGPLATRVEAFLETLDATDDLF